MKRCIPPKRRFLHVPHEVAFFWPYRLTVAKLPPEYVHDLISITDVHNFGKSAAVSLIRLYSYRGVAQPRVTDHGPVAGNIVPVGQCSQMKRSTGNARDQHVTVGQYCVEANRTRVQSERAAKFA
jgi:hypothetical protein